MKRIRLKYTSCRKRYQLRTYKEGRRAATEPMLVAFSAGCALDSYICSFVSSDYFSLDFPFVSTGSQVYLFLRLTHRVLCFFTRLTPPPPPAARTHFLTIGSEDQVSFEYFFSKLRTMQQMYPNI